MPRPFRILPRAGSTDQLSIEPLAAEHIAKLIDPLLDPKVYQWIEPHRDEASFWAFCEAIIAGPGDRFPDQTWWNHALFDRVSGAGVGRLEATFIGDQVEVAYLLGSRWWHRGMGSEALNWLVDEIRQAAPEITIWATVHPENEPSQRVLLRNGFSEVHDFPDTLRSYDPGDLVYLFDAKQD